MTEWLPKSEENNKKGSNIHIYTYKRKVRINMYINTISKY